MPGLFPQHNVVRSIVVPCQANAAGLIAEFPMDMWSIACTIYELFTAEILFKGRNNNEMLKLIMDLKGPIPKRMIKKGMFSFQHFAGAHPPQLFLNIRSIVCTLSCFDCAPVQMVWGAGTNSYCKCCLGTSSLKYGRVCRGCTLELYFDGDGCRNKGACEALG